MARAAMALLKNLEPAQLQQATFPFESEGARTGTSSRPRTFRARTPASRHEAKRHELLRGRSQAGLSQRGYLTATSIMDLETVLKALEAAQQRRPQPPRGALERDPNASSRSSARRRRLRK
jgi:hypothetical protein